MIDLDVFKHVNDTLGVEGGDCLLKLVAERLEANLPRDALLARQNADEFLILLRAIRNSFEPTLIAEKLLTALQERFVIGQELIHLSGSIGVTLAPADGTDAESLIRKADMAMSQAKQAGKNRVKFFAQEYEAIANQRLSIRNSLRSALTNQEFFVEFQPKVRIQGEREIIGSEALLRWVRSDGSRISPLQFIPIAEEYGFINEIGEWVIASVCEQLAQWRNEGCVLMPVAINISLHQLLQENFVDILRFNLMTRDLPTHLLEIEITESALMQEIERTTQLLGTLQELGIHVAIDDFGTGYSSFSYLKHLPVETLKIDKTFIDDMLKSPRDNALVRTLIQLAHTLGMKVVAEGVETHASLSALIELGCDQVQGFIFSKPISASELCTLACP
ncbi:MAG: bifunctional diguanylate cyclase/phosphodiesterase [Hahellaceae bacterium]|nr:bifunctional diguanylate cyclase/phosphodiesterase [Hahellaceae bacterium]